MLLLNPKTLTLPPTPPPPTRYHDVVGGGRCPVVDTWWQTETGGHMIAPLPGAWTAKPGAASLPFLGVVPAIVDDKGAELEGEAAGLLVIKSSWPSAMRTIYKDHARFEATYFAPYPGALGGGGWFRIFILFY